MLCYCSDVWRDTTDPLCKSNSMYLLSSLTRLFLVSSFQHWDKELPGRVTHVRYEDLVHDMPGMAKAIIEATGLEWHEDVLEFHKKKHAVNTLSTTQVRKGIYKNSLKSWMKYEQQLQPLVDLIGDRVNANRETTLPTYTRPTVEETEA